MQSRLSCSRFRAPDHHPGPGRFPAPGLRPGSFLASVPQHHRFSDRPRALRRSSVASPLAPRKWLPARSIPLSDSFPACFNLLSGFMIHSSPRTISRCFQRAPLIASSTASCTSTPRHGKGRYRLPPGEGLKDRLRITGKERYQLDVTGLDDSGQLLRNRPADQHLDPVFPDNTHHPGKVSGLDILHRSVNDLASRHLNDEQGPRTIQYRRNPVSPDCHGNTHGRSPSLDY